MISRIEQLRGWVVSLERWPRRVAALLLGVVTALALPPLYILPFLIPGFVGLAWLIEGSSSTGRLQRTKLTKNASRSAFAVGWWFGVGFFAAGMELAPVFSMVVFASCWSVGEKHGAHRQLFLH